MDTQEFIVTLTPEIMTWLAIAGGAVVYPVVGVLVTAAGLRLERIKADEAAFSVALWPFTALFLAVITPLEMASIVALWLSGKGGKS